MDIDLTQLKQLITIAENANIGQLEISDKDQRIRITCQPPIFTLLPAFSTASGSVAPQHAQANVPSPLGSDPKASAFQVANHASSHASGSAVLSPDASSSDASSSDTASPDNASTITVTSPMVGTFYRSAEPGTPPLVNEGDDVAVGDTLCIVEAMKILHEVKAEQAGKVQHIAINDGDMVEYGQTLFELQPTGV